MGDPARKWARMFDKSGIDARISNSLDDTRTPWLAVSAIDLLCIRSGCDLVDEMRFVVRR
jgi:hypothetical protein